MCIRDSHDIALWTDAVLNYVGPSADRVEKALGGQMTPEQLQMVRDMVVYHHKITAFTGPHADTVNAVRRADWVDASMGFIRHGMSRANVAAVQGAIPNEGFHDTLMGFGPRLHGSDWFSIVNELRKIYYL
eukprot:TRINITY_DN38841_c0_g1_i3.p2 TRINITY_DN38841_c0_g1~~TRINITY_DN38841_c0_g1_i3.p2  ORF type:complete len:131 (-),score=32.95 TRINITY_DN38841_c0_g1_i3:31-423(-)